MEKFKREMNSVITRKLMKVGIFLRNIDQQYKYATNLNIGERVGERKKD